MPSPRRLHVPADLVVFLRRLPPSIKQKVRAALDLLVDTPHEGKPLRGDLTGLWSLRVGRFRIIYRMAEHVLDIVAVGPRSTIYPEVLRRLREMRKP